MTESQYDPGDRVQLKIAFATYREHYDDAFGNILDAGTPGVMIDAGDGRLHFQPDGQDDHWYVLDHTLELERPAPVEYHCDHCGGVLGEACAKIAGFEGKRFCSSACAHDYRTLDSSDRLVEIEARLADRTPGGLSVALEYFVDGVDCVQIIADTGGMNQRDVRFYAHAPDYLEWAVAEIKRLRAEHKRQLVRNAELLQGNSILARRNESLSATLARRGLDDSGLPYGGEIDPNARPESFTAIERGKPLQIRYSDDDDHNEALQDAFESDEDDNDDGRYERGCS